MNDLGTPALRERKQRWAREVEASEQQPRNCATGQLAGRRAAGGPYRPARADREASVMLVSTGCGPNSQAESVRGGQTSVVIELDAAAVVRNHVRAFNARDLDTLIAGFTDDAVWITGTTIARGRSELTELFAGAMAGLLPTLTIENLLAETDRAACQLTETLTIADEEQTFSIAAFYRLRDGCIASAKVYREGSAEIG